MAPFNSIDILQLANKMTVLGGATLDEQLTFLEEQIQKPFTSNNSNYFKEIKRLVSSKDELDEHCATCITQIQDVYPGLTIDLSEYDKHLAGFFMNLYKFFVKDAQKLMYLFIKEFIFNNKNRKGLVDPYNTAAVVNYPKEQYGKKEFYLLIIKLPKILDDIFDDGVKLKKFIEYISRSEDAPVYLDYIRERMDDGYIIDKGVVADMYAMFKKSELYRSQLNKLEIDIYNSLILPYMEANGLMDVRIPAAEDIPEETDEEDDDDE
ncbi:MAG: hypothetical protein NC114_06440 [Ruminococcus flavefaciens]|nr:hypothetical protein [Ruminococcus flavefaciens]